MPERPLTIPSQLLARSLPSGETMPIPVTTTRRFDMAVPRFVAVLLGSGSRCCKHAGPHARPRCRNPRRRLRLDVGLDVVDRGLHGADLLGFLVRDLALEFFLER